MTAPALDVPTAGRCRVHLPPTLVSISISRSAVRRVTVFRDSDAESAFLVALTEIVANAIDEHVRLGRESSIVLEICFGEVDFVRVIDVGDGLRPEREPNPPEPPDPAAHGDGSDAPLERGRGLALARALVPAIEFEVSDRGTAVTIPLDGFGIVR